MKKHLRRKWTKIAVKRERDRKMKKNIQKERNRRTERQKKCKIERENDEK